MPTIAPVVYGLNDFSALNPTELTKNRISHNNQIFCSAAHFSLDKKSNALSLLADYLQEGVFAFGLEDKESKIITIWQEKHVSYQLPVTSNQ